MTLFKQLSLMLTLFLVVILVSIMGLNFKTSTLFVQNQLYADAKNTAHSLGLSLSHVADPEDTSTMKTMMDAIFDSGYYEMIRLNDVEGKIIYERKTDVVVQNVPQWFIRKVPIENQTAFSDIMIGWNHFGTLAVQGHTGHAYQQLYGTLMDLIKIFCILGVIVFAVLYLLLSLSLQSLKRISAQAKGIINNQFIFEERIPFTTEFRLATIAMNGMVGKVKDIFDREDERLKRYHELKFKDSESYLFNRRYLTNKLPDYLEMDTSFPVGVFILFGFDALDRLKQELGYEAYRSLIVAFATVVKGQFEEPHTLIARLNESDFFLLIPSKESKAVIRRVEEVMRQMQEIIIQQEIKIIEYLVLGCGMGNYSQNDTLKTLLSRADYSLTQAKLRHNFAIDLNSDGENSLILGREEWRKEILLSLQESRIILASQCVLRIDKNESEVTHQEIFLRLVDQNGSVHCAGYFIPIATSLGLIDKLDRNMIAQVFNYLKTEEPTISMALNFSADFITKSANLEWLMEQLELFSRYKSTRLCFEVSNSIALSNPKTVTMVAKMVKKWGHRFGIDHFILPESGAGYLQEIDPDYVKANGEYLVEILFDSDSQSVRESLHNVMKSLNIIVIAVMIETQQQLKELQNVGIKHFQGSFIDPVALVQHKKMDD
jgi:EAL domain-containing protein (putative c-di-GMP-specific phosphodiesterase class I)/GGDEF domain-containing protein